MTCEICGRSSCARCFHSLAEQEEFDTKTGRYAPEEDVPSLVANADIVLTVCKPEPAKCQECTEPTKFACKRITG